MKRIFLAIGFKDLEDFLKESTPIIEKHTKEEVKFVGEALYRESILQGINATNPNIVIIREGLVGKGEFSEILLNLKLNYPDIRIIFLAGNREVGDALLATLVQYGIYDLIVGSKLDCTDIVKKIIKPNKLSDVAQFLPKITLDEKTNTKLFEAPEIPNVNSNETPQIMKGIDELELDLNKEEEEKISVALDKETQDEIFVLDDLDDLEESISKDEEIEYVEPKPIKEPVKETVKEPIKEKIEPKEEEIDEEPIKNTNINRNKKNNSFLGGLFKGKKSVSRLSQQVLTFIGGSRGVGNSQIAFNTALELAQEDYKVIYIDLNERFSSLGYVYQLGYLDAGIDTMLRAFENSDFNEMNLGISNTKRIIATTSKDDYLYKTYLKFPQNIDFLFFSEEYMKNEFYTTQFKRIDANYLKDLIVYLLTNHNYDFIILDAPSDIYNDLTKNALIYSTKIFFTITQDVSVIGNHINDLKVMIKNGINFREKFYYLINKYENSVINNKEIGDLLYSDLKINDFNPICIPNINKELIKKNFEGAPIIWDMKSKEFKMAFSNIIKIIVNNQ